MNIGERIAEMRKAAGMTQEQLAEKVYVTRQAVSRWETGESVPGIDIRKLVAAALGISVIMLLDLPDEPVCQSCGTPFSIPNMPHGTDSDGSENKDFCKWCYENGEFTNSDADALIEYNAPYLAAATGMSQEEAVSFMGAFIHSLKRWK